MTTQLPSLHSRAVANAVDRNAAAWSGSHPTANSACGATAGCAVPPQYALRAGEFARRADDIENGMHGKFCGGGEYDPVDWAPAGADCARVPRGPSTPWGAYAMEAHEVTPAWGPEDFSVRMGTRKVPGSGVTILARSSKPRSY